MKNTYYLKDYKFGYADAETEFLQYPVIFEKAFYDSRDIVGQLIDDYQYMLIGRKGVGKSAFSAKIRSLASNNENLVAEQFNLQNFEFNTFSKTSVSANVTGTQKYKLSWDFILLLSICKVIHKKLNISEVKEFNNAVKFLNDIGFSINSPISRNISSLSRLKAGANLGMFDTSFEKEFEMKPTNFSERISEINEYLLEVLNEIYFNDTKIILLIDGLDDLLRIKKNQLEILSSLVRSVDYLRKKFLEYDLPLKIILFIREDIVSNITDPDFNKIKMDGSITLNWHNRIDDLRSIVNLRFKLSDINCQKVDHWWYEIFPRKVWDKDSWEHVLNHTLCKPRDILQFLKCCQEVFPNKSSLTYSELQDALKVYSTDYFLEEMKNELAGFIDDNIINALPSILQRLGNRHFDHHSFQEIAHSQILNKNNLSPDDVKQLLLLLFEAGYIGQLVPTKHGKKTFTNVHFKYRDPKLKIDYSLAFITHRGLYNGLGIRYHN